MAFTYEYPRAGVTVDCVVFGYDGGDLKVLLIQRDVEPFEGTWALPGGFVRVEETLEEAARRELEEETGARIAWLEQLYTFGALDRDPRERIISVAYYALVKPSDYHLAAATDARRAEWFVVRNVPQLAFDHAHILDVARQRLQAKVRYQPVGFELLPKKFTLSQIQRLYETILERPLDKRNFRKKIQKMGLLIALDEMQQDVAHRAARLYSFDKKKYERLVKKGFNFEL